MEQNLDFDQTYNDLFLFFFNENYITIRNIEKTMRKIDEWKIIGIIDRSIRIFVRNDCRKKYGGKKFLNLLKPSHQILIE